MLNNYNTKVTVELRELIDAGVNVWDFEYPSYYKDEAKHAFEQKVIDHYFFRQIGQETPARWLHYFRTRIREIMPYYIQLYKSCELMDAVEDPFESYNLTETFTQETTGTEKVTGSGNVNTTSTENTQNDGSGIGTRNVSTDNTKNDTNDATRKFSNTPQGSIENLDRYMTEASVDSSEASETIKGSESSSENTETHATATANGTSNTTSTESGTSEETGKVTHTLTRKGNIGVQPLGSEVNALRASFLNVDKMIIDELNDLFLLVY